MGRSNGAKAEKKREKNMKKQPKVKGGGRQKEDKDPIVCQVCRTTFLPTSKEVVLRDHHGAKHAKLPFEQCFKV